MSHALPLLFDLLYWLFWTVVYTAAVAVSVLVADLLWGPSVLERAFALVVAYLTFLHAFVLVLGVLKRLVQPRLHTGKTQVGKGRAFLAWGLNSVFQGIFTASFCADQIHLLFWLRYAYYRLMGMQLSPGTIIGTGCSLRQVEMISLGRGVTIGMNVTMSCHLSPDGKSHVQAPISIGARTLIGADSRIGPGIAIGSDCVVGANSSLTTDLVIGDGVRMGPHTLVRPGVRIGDGARIAGNSVVDRDVAPGETWPKSHAESAEPRGEGSAPPHRKRA
jgi:acetyltransferase-like isoleucine patch superfamily enzyme